MGLFSKARIESEEREGCVTYDEATTHIMAFWDRESELFNHTLVKYGNSITENPVVTSEVRKAGNRLVQAAEEVIRRHEAIEPVPAAALRVRGAERVAFLYLKEWAEGNLAGLEALASGMTPHYEYLQMLMKNRDSAFRKAEDERKKLLRQLGLTAPEIEAIQRKMHSSFDAAKADSWQPEPCACDFNEPAETPQQPTTRKARSIQVGVLISIPSELLVAMQQVKKVKKYSGGPPCDEGDFQRVLNVVFEKHAKLDPKHANRLMTEYLELPASFEPIWGHFTREQLCWLSVAGSKEMGEYDKAEANFALFSLLDGAFPAPDKICLLKGVFTEQIVQGWLSLREKNLGSAATLDDFSEVVETPQQA